jgi:hypothetical protein
MSSIFNSSNVLAKGFGELGSSAVAGVGKAIGSAGKALGSAAKAVGAAFADACPGTSFQLGKYRTDDGTQFYTDSQGKHKVCERKNLFGKNDIPFYFDGKENQIAKEHWKDINYGKRRKSSKKGRKAKRRSMKRKSMKKRMSW